MSNDLALRNAMDVISGKDAELTRLRERNAELEKERDEALNMLSTTALMNAAARISSLEATVRDMREALGPFRHNLFGWGVPDKVIISIRAALVSSESGVKSEGEKDDQIQRN